MQDGTITHASESPGALITRTTCLGLRRRRVANSPSCLSTAAAVAVTSTARKIKLLGALESFRCRGRIRQRRALQHAYTAPHHTGETVCYPHILRSNPRALERILFSELRTPLSPEDPVAPSNEETNANASARNTHMHTCRGGANPSHRPSERTRTSVCDGNGCRIVASLPNRCGR